MKKVISVFLSVFMLVTLLNNFLVIDILANDDIFDDLDAIAISSKSDLDNIRNNPSGKYYLTDNIVFTDDDFNVGGDFYNSGAGWIPIKNFTGVLDGKGFNIIGLKIIFNSTKNSTGVGLFATTNGAVIKNITLRDGTVVSYASSILYNGGVVGDAVNTTFINCYNYNIIKGYSSGGIAGRATNATIFQNCINYGEISFAETYDDYYYGGIVGHAKENVQFIECGNYGFINCGSSGSSGGGIVGFCYTEIKIEACYNYGTVSYATDSGGIVGSNYSSTPSTIIQKCYNVGDVSGAVAGGIIGVNGYEEGVAIIENCYNLGKINGYRGSARAGGISSTGGKIQNCYNLGIIMGEVTAAIVPWDGVVINSYSRSDQTYTESDGAILCFVEDMKKQSTYKNFDFDEVWNISDNLNNGFPVLQNMVAPYIDNSCFDLQLSHKKLSNNSACDSMKGVYEYEITAEIKNSAEATARDMVATLDLKEGLRVADGSSLSIDLGDVASGESAYAKWTVFADWPESNIAANYGVTANIGNSASLRQENYIYLLSRNENDNTFILGVDEWNFSNSGTFYDPSGSETYYMTASDYAALMESLNNSEKQSITSYRDSNWGGSCYGMSAVAILVKMGVIEPTIIQDGSATLHSISKVNNDNVESLINFYHFQQKTNVATMNKIQFALQSTEKQLEEIEAKATAVSTGGSPFLLAFSGNGWGHAVVAYGMEKGSYSFGGILGLFADKYDSRILIYDCSNLSSPEKSYLYYNSGTDEWYIPQYSDANKLIMACNDISVLDYVNYEVITTNHVARLVFEGEDGYLIHYKGSQLQINADTDLRSEGIIAFYDANILADGTYGKSELTLALPDLTSDYTVIPSGSTSGFTMYYENTVLSVDCDSVDQIQFNAEGGVLAQGISGDYTITLLQNDGAATTPWNQTTISGKDGENISLVQTSNGVVLTGTNLKNISIETTDNSGTQTTALSTECNSVLLTSNETSGNIPVVMLDSNGDGSYESEYNKYTVTFDANGGTGNMDALDNVAAGAVILPSNGFNPPSGMRFKGWSENATGAVIEGTEYIVSDDVTLYAIWEEVEDEPNMQPDDETTNNMSSDGSGASDNDLSDDANDGVNETPIDTEMIKLIAIGVVIAGVLFAAIVLIIKKKR